MSLKSMLLMVVASFAFCAMSPSQHRVQKMLDSTVKINVKILYVHDDSGDEELTGWHGSAVVYDKMTSDTGITRSLLLSATHVFNIPAVGGPMPDQDGTHVKAVSVEMVNHFGDTCNVTPLALGDEVTEDVATGEADCDAGPAAAVADVEPGVGAHIFITGYSLGIDSALVTEGYIAEPQQGYVLLSAPAAPGNSGGPVWYNGKVVGILVRGSPRYEHLTLSPHLAVIRARMAETK